MKPPAERARSHRSLLLAAGVVLGLALAAVDMVRSGKWSRSAMPAEVIATVDGREISRVRYEALLSDLAEDSRHPLDAGDRRFALQRLIDEELLVLAGIELGMGHADPSVRKAIVSTLISSVASPVESTEVDESQLRDFFEANRGYFAQNARPVVHWFRAARSELAEGDLAELSTALKRAAAESAVTAAGLARVQYLPEQPLTPAKARDYMGQRLTEIAFDLSEGEWSEPHAFDGWVHVFHVPFAEPAVDPVFEDVRVAVEKEYRRRRAEEALERYLAGLREGRDIRIQPGFEASQ